MKNSVAASTLLAGLASAAVVPRQAASTDLDPVVLNFALTLEHLENNFYSGAANKFTAQDFIDAGAPAKFYENIKYIASDEATHVQELTDLINANGTYKPVAACTYDFPYSDAKGYLGLATILEGVGVSAYLGAAGLVTNKDYLTAAASILVVESLHTAILRSATDLVPNANPNGTPLDPTSVYTLAAPFIKECPPSNPALPFKAFPTASGPSGVLAAGASVAVKTTAQIPAGSYLTFVSGLTVASVQGTVSNGSISAAIPAGVSGQSYILITKSDAKANGGKLVDTDVVAGPAVIQVAPVLSNTGYNGTATSGAAMSSGTAGYSSSSPSSSSAAAGYNSGSPTVGAGTAGGAMPSTTNAVYTGAASKVVSSGLAIAGLVAAFFML